MLKRFSHFIFSTKVWLTSAIVTPLFFFMINPMKDPISNFGKPGEAFLLMVLFGIGFSIPNWILLIITTWQLNKKGNNINQIKSFLTIISIGLTFILFYFLNVLFESLFLWSTPFLYAFTLAISIRFYHLRNVESEIAWIENILDDNTF